MASVRANILASTSSGLIFLKGDTEQLSFQIFCQSFYRGIVLASTNPQGVRCSTPNLPSIEILPKSLAGYLFSISLAGLLLKA
ncbi:MAG: hypothetical protein S4CHLAM81_08450 [Chlamydiales bacterium]|nr:hypothetical protein [Chlamydiales bacterium]MCH9635627.1 hypothetical protein [Chlamydiales bacterium]